MKTTLTLAKQGRADVIRWTTWIEGRTWVLEEKNKVYSRNENLSNAERNELGDASVWSQEGGEHEKESFSLA